MPKLFNTIVIYDTYVVAESGEAAREALLEAIRDGKKPAEPTEHVAREARNERDVRPAQHEKLPTVAGDVSDKDFDKIKGKTIIEVFKQLYTKTPPK